MQQLATMTELAKKSLLLQSCKFVDLHFAPPFVLPPTVPIFCEPLNSHQ